MLKFIKSAHEKCKNALKLRMKNVKCKYYHEFFVLKGQIWKLDILS